MDPKVKKRYQDTPIKYRKLYLRCAEGTASKKDAIKMQCLECWGWNQKETTSCNNTACPLFQYRPYKDSKVVV